MLRIRNGSTNKLLETLYVFVGSEVTLKANGRLQLRCRVPHAQEFDFKADSEQEAEAWHDALKAERASKMELEVEDRS